MAKEIIECSGPNGTNVEYVLFLTWFLRKYIPESNGFDSHLDDLETALTEEIQLQGKSEKDFIRPLLKPPHLEFKKCEKCVTS